MSALEPPYSDEPELIRLAYAMAVEPHKHHLLAEVVDKHIEHHYQYSDTDTDTDNSSHETLFESIDVHFQNAVSMLDGQGRRLDTSSASRKIIERDPKPVALIDKDGRILLTNSAGQEQHHWQDGISLSADNFDESSFPIFQKSLTQLDSFDSDKAICLVHIFKSSSLKSAPYVVTKTVDTNGQTLARLSSVNISWLPDVAYHFQENFKLTPIELRITQAIVTSQSLRDLAKERGRSLGTLRNQLKALLSKLGLNSQIELSCLYSGYIQLTKNAGSNRFEHSFRSTPWRRQNMFIAEDGFKIDYSEVGPISGRPVLFFHPMIFGTSVTEQLRRQLGLHNIKLIMPWRPGFANTSLTPSKEHALTQFAHYCVEFLDYLKIERVQIVGQSTGMIPAMKLASVLKDRAIAVCGISPVIPITNRKYFKLMALQQRSLYYISKHAPKLLSLAIRATVAKVDSGFDEEWLTNYFLESPLDLATMSDPAMKALARQGFTMIYMNGIEGAVRDFIETGRKWQNLFDDYQGPITLISGQQSREFQPIILKDFAKEYKNVDVESIENAAHFVVLQQAEAVIDIISRQYHK